MEIPENLKFRMHDNTDCRRRKRTALLCSKKVQLGNDQEMAQSERNSHSKTEAGKPILTFSLPVHHPLCRLYFLVL